MPSQLNIIVDFCEADSKDALKDLVEASKRYWQKKGYDLISNDTGPDTIFVFESQIDSGSYEKGVPKYTNTGGVALVYQRSE